MKRKTTWIILVQAPMMMMMTTKEQVFSLFLMFPLSRWFGAPIFVLFFNIKLISAVVLVSNSAQESG